MYEELSYQIINTSAANQAVFCYYQNIAKIIIEKKTLVLTVASKGERDLAKRIYISLGPQVYMSFSIFIFSTGIKLFIRHPVVLFGILILSEQFDGFAQLHPRCILKDRQLSLHKYVSTEFYIALSLRQNKSRYQI